MAMMLANKRIGFAMTGSFCNFDLAFGCLERILAEGAAVTPIVSPIVDNTDTRFGLAKDIKAKLTADTGNEIINTIDRAEPIGPQKLLDLLLIIPATGNSIAKLANGIADTAVLMAAKSQLRNEGPVVIAVSSNDALGNGAKNVGALLNARNVYFVPFGQDSPFKKPRSLIFKPGLVLQTLTEALEGRQVQPVLV
jgi:dipicolinate synthase subunit B